MLGAKRWNQNKIRIYEMRIDILWFIVMVNFKQGFCC